MDAYALSVVLPTELLREERLRLPRGGRPESEGRLDSDGRLCGRVLCVERSVYARAWSERTGVAGMEK